MSPVSTATATDRLRGLLTPQPRDHQLTTIGPKVYVIERARSRSNATQTVDFKVVTPGSVDLVSIGVDLALICGVSYDQVREGVIIREPLTVARLLEQFSAKVFGQAGAFAVEWL